MRGHIRRNVSIGVLVAALLASGLFVGVSYGSTESTTVRLTFGEPTRQHTYPLRDEQGRASAKLETFKGPLLDEDGTRVGTHRCECLYNGRIGWWCTHILSLHPGAFTGEGTVVITGLFKGFNGEELAIVGGTGDYAGANGTAIATVEGDEFLFILTLQA